jgi:hypothetical protein
MISALRGCYSPAPASSKRRHIHIKRDRTTVARSDSVPVAESPPSALRSIGELTQPSERQRAPRMESDFNCSSGHNASCERERQAATLDRIRSFHTRYKLSECRALACPRLSLADIAARLRDLGIPAVDAATTPIAVVALSSRQDATLADTLRRRISSTTLRRARR